MKKIIALLGMAFFVSCETSDSCQCEVYENIGTEEQPQFRYIGAQNGSCDNIVKEEKYRYDSVNCQ